MAKHAVTAKQATEELVKILENWQGLEDQTISLSRDLSGKTTNPFLKVIMEMIERDSEKHKSMLQFALDNLTKQSTSLSPQELIPLADILEKHVSAEAKSMGLANSAITKTKDFFVHFIISYLLADEVKHHEMLTRLEQVKGQVYPYGQTREERLGGTTMKAI